MSNQPNFLVLFTDQQRYDTIHALGCGRIQTPNLDALAASSMVFDRCYTPAPVCVPARFSMFSGLYCAHSGCCNNNGASRYTGEGFYHAFTQAGYSTCCVGKMHHAKDLYGAMGFERRFTQEELSHPQDDYTRFLMDSPYRNVFDYNGQRSEMYYIPQVSQLPMEYHPTQWVADRSLDFLESVPEDRPFFLMSSFIHPHPPFAPPAPWNKLYRTVSEDPYVPEDPEEFALFLSDRFTCEKIGISRQDLSLLRSSYYACVSFVDYQVGRIIDALKRRGLYDNTVIVFSSDHGEMLGDFGTMGKRSMLDAAARIPLLLRVPGGEAQLRHDVCSLVDIAPTLLRYAGISGGEGAFDGVDLLSSQHHDVVFSQYGTGKTGAYMAASSYDRLIYMAAADQFFYFDTIPEDTNKYDEASPRVRELKKRLLDYIAGDRCDPGQAATADDVSGISRFPYGPKRADHLMRQAEERARIPAGYTIDL